MKTLILSKENGKDLVDIPDEVREDLTIHLVDMIDEVLKFAIEPDKPGDVLETPQLWNADQPADVTTSIE